MRCNLLFRIVSGINENPGVKPLFLAITADNNYPMFIGLEKLIIQNGTPLSMEKLRVAKGMLGLVNANLPGLIQKEVLKIIWKLH